MLYMVGPVRMDTFPFMVDGVRRVAGADYATKQVMGGLKPREFGGEGDDVLTIKGAMCPFRPISDGTEELETLHGYRASGDPVFVMRGDGKVEGWFEIDAIEEEHTHIQANGVGFIVTYDIKMTRCESPGEGGSSLVSQIFSLFG